MVRLVSVDFQVGALFLFLEESRSNPDAVCGDYHESVPRRALAQLGKSVEGSLDEITACVYPLCFEFFSS